MHYREYAPAPGLFLNNNCRGKRNPKVHVRTKDPDILSQSSPDISNVRNTLPNKWFYCCLPQSDSFVGIFRQVTNGRMEIFDQILTSRGRDFRCQPDADIRNLQIRSALSWGLLKIEVRTHDELIKCLAPYGYWLKISVVGYLVIACARAFD